MVSDKMLRPLVNRSNIGMVTLGLPIVATILLLLCVLLVLVLVVRKRTEPKIPDLSDPKSDPLLDENPLFQSSISKELFCPPMEAGNLRMDTGLFVDEDNIKNSSRKKVSAHLDWLSPSSSDWLSINDDLYKNYYPRGSLPLSPHPVTSSRSLVRDSPRDELLLFRRSGGTREPGMVQDDPTTKRRGRKTEQQEEESAIGFTYNSPQPERIPLPSSSFISASSSFSFPPPPPHLNYKSTNNFLPYHHHSYPPSHYNTLLSYHHHSGGSGLGGGMSCCDPRFDHPGCLCSLNHFPRGPT